MPGPRPPSLETGLHSKQPKSERAGENPIDVHLAETTIQLRGMNGYWTRDLIRKRLLENRLPRGRALHVWDASGTARDCDGCGERIPAHETMRFGIVEDDDWTFFFFHAVCYKLWDVERQLVRHERASRAGL
jgi:hypothetical protein